MSNRLRPDLFTEFPIERYVISRELGVGAFGMVHLYELMEKYESDEDNPSVVAVKAFQSQHYFEVEVEKLEILSHNELLQHPNFVKIYGCCFMGNLFGIVMEKYDMTLQSLVDNYTLMSKGGHLDVALTRNILYQLANAMEFLHKKNLLHRDVKPDNILIRDDETGIQVALSDLGASRVIMATEVSKLTPAGTDIWMAPEVKKCRSKYGHSSDVYGFGLVALFIKTGCKPPRKPQSGNIKDDPFYNWLMGKKGIFEDEDLFDLTLDCLRYYPRDRLQKESLIDHKFFHPTENPQPYPLIRLQPSLNPLHEVISDATKNQKNKMKMRYGICALLLFIILAAISISLLLTETKEPVKKYPGRILIIGGRTLNDGENRHQEFENGRLGEVLDIRNPNFVCNNSIEIPSYSTINPLGMTFTNHTNGVICGGQREEGSNDNFCTWLLDTDQKINLKLKMKNRTRASLVKINETTIWIVGGLDEGCLQKLPPSEPIELCSVNSTELVPVNAYPPEIPEYGPTMPFGIFDHCMVKLDSGFIFIMGGLRNDINSTKSMQGVWIADFRNGFDLKAGPPLGDGKLHDVLLCGSYQNDAGGTSIFITFKELGEQNSTALVQWWGEKGKHEMMRTWTFLNMTLKVARKGAVVLPISDEVTSCGPVVP